MAVHARAAPRSRQPGVRDPRLDFFRGVAMLIIFVAHVPDNPWAGFIPARFGWSDATEMFVFCSGFAAAIAFGGSFATAGFGYGTVRSEEHTSELQSLMRISYAVFCLKKKNK